MEGVSRILVEYYLAPAWTTIATAQAIELDVGPRKFVEQQYLTPIGASIDSNRDVRTSQKEFGRLTVSGRWVTDDAAGVKGIWFFQSNAGAVTNIEPPILPFRLTHQDVNRIGLFRWEFDGYCESAPLSYRVGQVPTFRFNIRLLSLINETVL